MMLMDQQMYIQQQQQQMQMQMQMEQQRYEEQHLACTSRLHSVKCRCSKIHIVRPAPLKTQDQHDPCH